MIGGMGGIFKDATYGQAMRDASNNPEATSGAARAAGDAARILVTGKTANPLLGEIAGRFTEGVVNEFTRSDGGSELSKANLPKA